MKGELSFKGKEYWVLTERSIEFYTKGVLGFKGKENWVLKERSIEF